MFGDDELKEILRLRSFTDDEWGIAKDSAEVSRPITKEGGFVILTGTTFVGNTAGKVGGALYIHFLTLSSDGNPVIGLDRAVFSNNTAENGGAVGIYRFQGSMVFQNIDAFNNSADTSVGKGGFIFFKSPETERSQSALIVRKSAIWYNSAHQGGAIYADRESVVALSGVVGWQNYASQDGGFLHCEICQLLGT